MLSVFAVAALLCAAAAPASASPVANTVYGQVQGAVDAGTGALTFKGVPYAAPPVGNLRFADPQLVYPWAPQVLQATKFSPGCMARCPHAAFPDTPLMCPTSVSEDCLYLNVFTPTLNVTANLPVIVFIHGGNYVAGAGGVPLYEGGNLAMNQNVVVVTINYRLGIFGALYTGTTEGNYQTKDQRMALRWVRNAISAFGGNPQLVTLTGQSAGAASVATHLTSPKSWGLFQRTITVSNPFTLPADTPTHAITLGKKLLADLSCPEGGQLELDCLRNADANLILNYSLHDDHAPLPGRLLSVVMQWTPIVDGHELPFQPYYAWSRGLVAPGVPIMVGTVANESVQFLYDIFKTPLSTLGYDLFIDYLFSGNKTTLNVVNGLYGPPPSSFGNDVRMFAAPMATDYVFYCATRSAGRGVTAAGNPTFIYMFDYVSPAYKEIYNKFMPWCDNVVCHADDLAFIFYPWKSIPKNVPIPTLMKNETELSHFVQSAWGNFARTGNPNSPTALPNGVVWPQYNGAQQQLMNYSIPSNIMTAYRSEYCDQWDTVGYTGA